jgi:hypothetical protein
VVPPAAGGINFFSHCKMFVVRHLRRTVIFLCVLELVCHASTLAHGKGLSCVLIKSARQRRFTVKKVSCALCRAFPGKTHGKVFAVRFLFPVSRSEYMYLEFG